MHLGPCKSFRKLQEVPPSHSDWTVSRDGLLCSLMPGVTPFTSYTGAGLISDNVLNLSFRSGLTLLLTLLEEIPVSSVNNCLMKTENCNLIGGNSMKFECLFQG